MPLGWNLHVFSTVSGMQDFSKLPGYPAGFVVDKVDCIQFIVGRCLLLSPCQTTVGGVDNNAGPTDRPTLFIVEEEYLFEHLKFARRLLYPRFTAVSGM